MAHITFIHGISNKPAADRLLRIWLDSLTGGTGGIDLDAEGVTTSMIYWADVLYPEPVAAEAEFVNEANTAELPSATDPNMKWREHLSGEEKAITDALAAKLSFDVLTEDTYVPPVTAMDAQLERIPLPWFVKRRVMKEFLRDVHHYLFNETSSPRPGVSYKVRDEIRSRTIAALQAGSSKPGPHLLVSHSMGTVIAYDCLKRVPECPAVDGLMTVGSPLGIDEIQDKLKPEWSRANGFPSKVKGGWINIYDSLDPVTGFDGNIANDFKKDGREEVEVINEQNYGAWRHDIVKYLAGTKLRASLGRLLSGL